MDASTLSSVNPPSILSDPPTASNGGEGAELGPGFLLANGSVMIFGANGNTAIFTPSSSGGSWSAGPQEPQLPLTVASDGTVTDGGGPTFLVATDDPGAMLPDGNILIALSPLGSSNQGNYNFPNRTYIYEYDPATQTFTPANINNTYIPENAFALNMVELPSGQVLLGDESGTAEIYTPNGTPHNAWRPVVTNIVNNGNNTYTLTGTQLNGISEGTDYGDDLDSASNYPIVQLVNSTGQVYYARTYDWSSTGVATGSTPVSTAFTLPAGLQMGTYSLYVIANGIASNSVTFNLTATTSTTTAVASSLNPSTYGQSVTFTATVSDTGGGVPTGSVKFYDGSTDLGPGSPLSGSGNSATSTFTTSTLTAGSHSAINAVYTPTGNFAGSTGSLTQTVNTAALTITANSTSKTYGNTLTFAGTAFTESGLVNGDTVSSVTLTSTGAPAYGHGGRLALFHRPQRGGGLGAEQLHDHLRQRHSDGDAQDPDRQHHGRQQGVRRHDHGDGDQPAAQRCGQRRLGQPDRRHRDLRQQERGHRQDGHGHRLEPDRHGRRQLPACLNHGDDHGQHHPEGADDHRPWSTPRSTTPRTAAAATPTITAGSLQGSDTANFTETYASKNVGTNLVLTPSGTVNDGNSGNNYTYTFGTVSTGAITRLRSRSRPSPTPRSTTEPPARPPFRPCRA